MPTRTKRTTKKCGGGWSTYGIQNISLTPAKYVASMRWQVGPKKLTASRLATALSEDSHHRVSTSTASRILRCHTPSKIRRVGFGVYRRK